MMQQSEVPKLFQMVDTAECDCKDETKATCKIKNGGVSPRWIRLVSEWFKEKRSDLRSSDIRSVSLTLLRKKTPPQKTPNLPE